MFYWLKITLLSTVNTVERDRTATVLYTSEGNKGIEVEDFKIMRLLGTGGFAKVYLVCKKDNNKLYAMKE